MHNNEIQFVTSIESLAEQFKTMSTEQIRGQIIEMAIQIAHGRKVTMFNSEEWLVDSQGALVGEKANQYKGVVRPVVFVIEVAATAVAVVAPIFQALALAAKRYDEIKFQDGRGFFVTIDTHQIDRLSKLIEEVLQNMHQADREKKESIDAAQKELERMHSTFMEVARG